MSIQKFSLYAIHKYLKICMAIPTYLPIKDNYFAESKNFAPLNLNVYS